MMMIVRVRRMLTWGVNKVCLFGEWKFAEAALLGKQTPTLLASSSLTTTQVLGRTINETNHIRL